LTSVRLESGDAADNPRIALSVNYEVLLSAAEPTDGLRQRFPRVWLALVLLSLSLLCRVQAQELYLLAGGQRTSQLDENTYAYEGEYAENLSDHVFVSFTYLNEGHVTDHHRDGHSVQLWFRELSPSRRFDLSAGIGPYRYYDTTTDQSSGDTIDAHGRGLLFSLAAHWYLSTPWIMELRYDRVQTTSSINTDILLLGVGWQFDVSQRPGPVLPTAPFRFSSADRNELTAFIGKTVLNNFSSPEGLAWAVEYRRNLTPFIDVTGAFIDEGYAPAIKRQGVAVQAWLSRAFHDERASVGVGVGPYLARGEAIEGIDTRVLGLFTMTASYRFSARWDARLSWYRTVTNDSRDADVLLLGVGRSF
jgi:hypothetical protein